MKLFYLPVLCCECQRLTYKSDHIEQEYSAETMSYVVDDAGDKYRGGYASSGFNPDEVRVQSSTFENYVGGTVLLVFVIFFVFLFISMATFMLMCYARYCIRVLVGL